MNNQRTHQTQYILKPSHQDQTRLAPLSPPFSFYPQSVDFLIAIFIAKTSTRLTSPPPGLPHQAGGGPQAARGDQTFSPPLQSLGLKRIE